VDERENQALMEAVQTRRPSPDVLIQQRAQAQFDRGPRGSSCHGSAETMRETVRSAYAFIQPERLVECGFCPHHPDPLPAIGPLDIAVPALLPLQWGGRSRWLALRRCLRP
jgi:hypothetical protein